MRLGILTGGGDFPGLDAVIRAAVARTNRAPALRAAADPRQAAPTALIPFSTVREERRAVNALRSVVSRAFFRLNHSAAASSAVC